MQRRGFLRGAGVIGAGAAGFAAPAIAQSLPEVKWRCASSFPRVLDTVFGAGEMMAKVLAEATDNRFQIRVHAAGDVARPLEVADAVQAGTVECGHTAAYYHAAKDPTFAFETALPFGLSARQQDAWMAHGGGRPLMNEFFRDFNIHAITCGNTGAQMGGWFRKEIKTVDDLKGLKIAIGGLAAAVMAKLGMVPQQLAAGDISAALEKGTVDAAK